MKSIITNILLFGIIGLCLITLMNLYSMYKREVILQRNQTESLQYHKDNSQTVHLARQSQFNLV